jgi:hypothetical protein
MSLPPNNTDVVWGMDKKVRIMRQSSHGFSNTVLLYILQIFITQKLKKAN